LISYSESENFSTINLLMPSQNKKEDVHAKREYLICTQLRRCIFSALGKDPTKSVFGNTKRG
jgi:hypothetical protein